MTLDYPFIVKMLEKHQTHLAATRKNLEAQYEGYQSEIDALEKLGTRYIERIREITGKKSEALIKLGHVVPNLEKIIATIAELKETHNIV